MSHTANNPSKMWCQINIHRSSLTTPSFNSRSRTLVAPDALSTPTWWIRTPHRLTQPGLRRVLRTASSLSRRLQEWEMCLTDQQCKRGRPESKLRGKRDFSIFRLFNKLGVCSVGWNVSECCRWKLTTIHWSIFYGHTFTCNILNAPTLWARPWV